MKAPSHLVLHQFQNISFDVFFVNACQHIFNQGFIVFQLDATFKIRSCIIQIG